MRKKRKSTRRQTWFATRSNNPNLGDKKRRFCPKCGRNTLHVWGEAFDGQEQGWLCLSEASAANRSASVDDIGTAATAVQNRVLTREKYEFECRLRHPDLQRDLLQFLKEFPVFYRLKAEAYASFGGLEPKVRETWENFFRQNGDVFDLVESHPSYRIFRFRPKSAAQALKLSSLEEEIVRTDRRLTATAIYRSAAKPQTVIARIEPYKSVLAQAAGYYNPEYFRLADRTPSEYQEREEEFLGPWDTLPHHIQPPWKRVELLFPPWVPLTQKSVAKLWREFNEGKERPGRKDYATLLAIYDRKQEGKQYSEIGEELGLSADRVEKLYRRVASDIHGSKVREFLKSRRHRRLSRTRVPFSRSERIGIETRTMEETYGGPALNEDSQLLLWQACHDVGIPLDELEKANFDPLALPPEKRMRLRDYLKGRRRDLV